MGNLSVSATKEKRPQDWSAEEQLVALHETHGLSGETLHTWCRERGLFAHHLTSWKSAFCADGKAAPGTREFRVLKDENENLKRELVRKEKASARASPPLPVRARTVPLPIACSTDSNRLYAKMPVPAHAIRWRCACLACCGWSVSIPPFSSSRLLAAGSSRNECTQPQGILKNGLV